MDPVASILHNACVQITIDKNSGASLIPSAVVVNVNERYTM